MSPTHYRASFTVAASLSLALAACVASPPAEQRSAEQPGAAATQKAASSEPEDIDTEANILTVLGLAKKESVKDPGPQTGRTVSPVLWQAAHDTLNFVKYVSEDPLTGSIVTDWYSPPGNPNLRYRVNVFILSRALHSDSLTVTVDRQQRSVDGQWAETTIARQVETDLENAILSRARQLKRAWAAAAPS
jgi:ribosomal protein L12E/L44/L45/RPP1/RPP2